MVWNDSDHTDSIKKEQLPNPKITNVQLSKLPVDQIVCGDNLQVISQFPDNCIDLIVTSPPYDSLRLYDGYAFQFIALAKETMRILKNGGVMVWIVGDQFTEGSRNLTSFHQLIDFREKIGFTIHDVMGYEKMGFRTPQNNRYNQSFELVYILSKGKPKTFDPIKDEKVINYGDVKIPIVRYENGIRTEQRQVTYDKEYKMRGNVWKYAVGFNTTTTDIIAFEHPAICPEKLVDDHIQSWSNRNDLVLDYFSGSGTTCKMAYLNYRHYIGIDISARYCEIARERISMSNREKYNLHTPKIAQKHIKSVLHY